jgi:ATP adenylyltransferase
MTLALPCDFYYEGMGQVKRLWAPWRLRYLVGEKPIGCIFCEKIKDRDDRAGYVIHRGDVGFIMLNLYPYNNGHLMVAPYAHVASLEDLDQETLGRLMALVNKGLAALRLAMKPDGFNVGVNIGAAAGAGVADHVHIHIVPRWNGDTNFMPTIAEAKVIPEMLDTTWEKLRQALASLG